MRLALDMLGVSYRHVTGYRSNNTARLALQQNEINFFSESPPGYRSVVEPSLVKTGMVIPVHYDPGWNGESIMVPKQMEGLTVLPFHELYRKLKGAPPSGQLWDVYLAMPCHQLGDAAPAGAATEHAAGRTRCLAGGGAAAQQRQGIRGGRA